MNAPSADRKDTDSATPSPSVRARSGAKFLDIGLSTFWRWAACDPDFPKAVKLSSHITVWRLHELVRYRDRKPQLKTAQRASRAETGIHGTGN